MGPLEISASGVNHGSQVAINHGVINISSNQPEPAVTIENVVLRSLAFPHMLDRRDNIEPCHPDTCQWILELEEYQSWIGNSHGLLWIRGKPGTGKSTLMRFLHDRREILRGQYEAIWLDFFFTARGEELQRTPLGMLRSLLNQIFDIDATVRPQICEAHQTRSKRFGDGKNVWEWPQPLLEDLLAVSILSSAGRKPVTIFVDALDESGAESAQWVASYFYRLVSQAEEINVTLLVCISCRHYPIMESLEAKEICVENHNHGDISRYIRDLLAGIEIQDHASDHSREVLTDQMIEQANGLFQWARLVIPFVTRQSNEGESLEDIRRWLQQVPNGLEDLYKYVMENVIEKGNRAQSYIFFQWLCLAERPLTVTELRYALVVQNAGMRAPVKSWNHVRGFIDNDERFKRRIKALSGGLAEVILNNGNATIQAVHQSVSDYLRSKGLKILCHHVDGSQAPTDDENFLQGCQVTLYRSCLGYIATMHLSQEWSDRLGEGPRVKPHLDGVRKNADICMRFKIDFPFIQYAIINLFTHARKCVETTSSSGADALERDYNILKQTFGRWIRIYTRLLLLERMTDYPCEDTTLLHQAAAANLIVVVKLLLQDGVDTTDTDEEGCTALHSAARRGHITAAKLLLENGANPDTESKYQRTPLTDAAACGNLKLVELILGHGANVKTARANTNPLQEAALKGQRHVVDFLLEAGADVNAEGGKYGFALQAAAARDGNSEIVQNLIDAGADVNAQGGKFGYALQAAAAGRDGMTPYFVPTPISGARRKILQMLLDAGADVNAQSGKHGNALQAAAGAESAEIVQILLDAGADVNIQSTAYDQATFALQVAAGSKNPRMVQIILDAGANVNAKDNKDTDALLAAAEAGESPEIVQMLLDAGANVNTQGESCGSVLHAAASGSRSAEAENLLDWVAETGVDVLANHYIAQMVSWAATVRGHNKEIVQLLVDAGAEINEHDAEMGTPLHVAAAACYKGSSEIMQIFLSAGADVNAQGGEYGDALQAASFAESIEKVQMLLSAGADVNAQHGQFGNALHAAIHTRSTRIVQMLLDAGADVNAQVGEYGHAIQRAARIDSPEMWQLLLDAGANVNFHGGKYGSSLLAAINGGNIGHFDKLLKVGADVLLTDELDQAPLHIAASKDLVEHLTRFPTLISAMNSHDKLRQTPLHLAVSLGHIQFALKLLRAGANPTLSDGYGRNLLDWAIGNDSLVHQIQTYCPQITITPLEDQKLATCQSILQASETLLHSKLNTPGPLVQQLGHYLLFLNHEEKARYLFQLKGSEGNSFFHLDGHELFCSICHAQRSLYVCRVCARMNLCPDCAQEYPNHSRLHPTQTHKMIEISPANDGKVYPREADPGELREFLSILVKEFSSPNAHKLGADVLNDAKSELALKEIDPATKAMPDLRSISYVLVPALIVALFSYLFL